jgi:hypothetical protein
MQVSARSTDQQHAYHACSRHEQQLPAATNSTARPTPTTVARLRFAMKEHRTQSHLEGGGSSNPSKRTSVRGQITGLIHGTAATSWGWGKAFQWQEASSRAEIPCAVRGLYLTYVTYTCWMPSCQSNSATAPGTPGKGQRDPREMSDQRGVQAPETLLCHLLSGALELRP